MKSNNQNYLKNNYFENIKIKFLIVFNLLTLSIIAQEQKLATIIQYDQFVNISKSETKSLKPLRIESLINDIQSAIYVEFDGIKTYGLKPVSLFTTIKNIPNITNPQIKKENIEIINIRINTFDDLKSNIDLKQFSEFKKLKYIYIISDIKCNESDIKPIIKNIGNYIVLYKIAGNS